MLVIDDLKEISAQFLYKAHGSPTNEMHNIFPKLKALVKELIKLSFKRFNGILFYISEVYADPSHSSYEALRFVSGVSTTFTPGV